jgi:hypothetical protein
MGSSRLRCRHGERLYKILREKVKRRDENNVMRWRQKYDIRVSIPPKVSSSQHKIVSFS